MGILLEPRFLFDGSVAATHRSATHTGHHTDAHHWTDAHEPDHEATPPAAVSDTPAPAASTQETPAAAASTAAPNSAIHELLFVDPRVANWQTLAGGANSDVQIIVLDPNQDGIAQVTAALQNYSGIEAVHFLTYGQPGQIELGSGTVNDATLAADAGQIAGWRDHLAAGASILFWGCDVGQGSAGQAFVTDLHSLTGAEIGASTDATGTAALGGDWTLELTTGPIGVAAPFSAAAIAAYQDVLDAPVAAVAFDASTVPASILLGSSFSETVTFQNTASAGIGYGPFIDLFVPSNYANAAEPEAVALSSATFLGTNLTVSAVTLSSTIAGHTGVVGALDPLAVDSTGSPLFVAAPTGFKAGDTMYSIQLPFGSYTPGEPAATVTLNFALDKHSQLTSSQSLEFAAIGGYQYGADPLANPTTDPSIIGTTPSLAQSSVNLLNVTAVMQTQPGEGETATGSDFPGHYIVTLNPAPATTGDAITNLDVEFTIPDDVQYTGGTITVGGPGAGATTSFTSSGHAQGGTVTVHFASLQAGGAATTIDIPVYVPQTDGAGAQVLSQSTGSPVPIALNPSYSYANGSWTPWTGSLDTVQTVAGDGTVGDAPFTAKSLAVQVSSADVTTGGLGTDGVKPGDTVQYTINFQISDFFGVDNLVLQDILGDGLSIDPTFAPTLSVTRDGVTQNIDFGAITSGTSPTVNGEPVNTAGTAADWNYLRDNGTTGQTTANFNVGALLAASGGSSVLQGNSAGTGGTYGTLTFQAKVLDKYTNTASGDFIRETDPVHDSVTASGDLRNIAGTPTGNTISDTSQVTDVVPQGKTSLVISAINGVAVTDESNVVVHPGDAVTYQLEYQLTSGDFSNLALEAYLPQPIFSATDPTNPDAATIPTSYAYTQDAGGGVASGIAGIYAGTPVPTVGTYALHTNGTGTVTVTSDSAVQPANSVTFNLGQQDSTSNSAATVDVYFTVTASSKPFAKDLFLTAQNQAGYSPAVSPNFAANAIQMAHLAEPVLTIQKGVVSIVGDNGANRDTASGVSFGGTAPTSLFADAGTTGNALSGTSPAAIDLTKDNLNLTGAQAGDTVRIVDAVQNTGDSTAYDVVLQDALPAGYTAADVSNLQVTRGDGTVLSVTKPDGSAATTADFFAGGVKINGAALQASGTNTDILYVTYDLKLQANAPTGTTVLTTTEKAQIDGWAGVAGGASFVTAGVSQVGGVTAASLFDTATVTTGAPTIAKVISAANDSTNVILPNVVVGEVETYQVTITLPEGETQKAGGVVLTDLLPAGMELVGTGNVTVTPSGNVAFKDPSNTANPWSPTIGIASASGGVSNQLTVNLGDVFVTTPNADTAGTVTITYDAYVRDVTGNTSGTHFANNAQLAYSGGTLTATKTVTEQDPKVAVTVTPDVASPVHSSEIVTYTVTLTNTGGDPIPAEDVTDLITVPGGLTYVAGSLHETSGPSATLDDSSPTSLSIGGITALAAGQSATFTFQATVDNNLAANSALTVSSTPTWTSMPNAVTKERTYTATGTNTLNTAQFVPSLSIVGESNGTSGLGTSFAPQSAVNATVGEIVRMHAYVQLPEGANASTILDLALPTGLQYLADGSATIALASPGGDITSSTIDPTGTTAGLQVAEGGTAINPASYTPSFVLPGSSVDTSTAGHVKVNLGTVQNNDNSNVPNYVLVEFNAVVSNAAADVAGTTLASTLTAGGQTTAATTVNIVEPHVTLTKTITGINETTGVVSYQVTATNTGTATANNVVLDDPQASNEGAITSLATSGTAAGLSVTSGTGSSDLHATMSLAAGATETFTYQTQVTDPTQAVPTATATVTYTSLNGDVQTLKGSTDGASGSSTGERNGTGGVNNYTASASTQIGVASGQVWQGLGTAHTTYDPNTDTPLAGVTVTATDGGNTITTTTDASGNYRVLFAGGGTAQISLPATGSAGGAPTGDTLTYNPFGTSLASATASVSGGAATTGVNFEYVAPDTAPQITNWSSGTITYAQAGGPVALSTTHATGVADTELAHLIAANEGYDYAGTVLTVQRYVGGVATPNALDVFGGDGTHLVLTGGSVTLDGATIGSFTQAGGTLTITFAAGTGSASVKGVLDNITYANTDSTVTASGVVIGTTLKDGNSAGAQGTGGVMTGAPAFATLNIGPNATMVAFTDPNDAPAASGAVAVDGTLLLSKPTGTFSQAVVQITGGLQAEDSLIFTSSVATTGNITGSYNPATGAMTLISAGNVATVAQWQAALRAVSYIDITDQPLTANRTVTTTVTDSVSLVTATIASTTVQVVAANDSPVLHGNPVTLADGIEDGAPPSGAVGTLVSSLIGGANVTDPDGAGVHDGAVAGTLGLAVVGADTSHGTWWYTTDNGATWHAFASSGLTAVSAANALHLVGDANTRVFFQATDPNFNGAIPTALTFRGWDQFDGAANGSLAALPTDGALGQGSNTLASAYSAAAQSLPLAVDAVNDAPIASGSATLPSVAANVTTVPGDSVTDLFGGHFSDAADQQKTGGNPTGSVANGLAGIAVVGDAATAAQGVWRYSLDGGATWTAVPTTVSDGAALILPASAKLSFLPAANFADIPGQLSVRLIDSSTSTVVAGLTGQALASSTVALSGIDVSGAHNGGITAISAGIVTLGTSVTPSGGRAILTQRDSFDLDRTFGDGFHSGSGFDLLDHEGDDQLDVVGSIGNRFILTEQRAVIGVPPNLFQQTNPNEPLTFEAKRPDGGSLPTWLTFDSRNMLFSGTPPKSAYGPVEITIVARDRNGHQAEASFRILVGRQPNDLLLLSQQLGSSIVNVPPPPDRDAPPAGARNPQQGDAAPIADPRLAQLAALDARSRDPAMLEGRTGFSAQLRQSGRMTEYARARALLNAL